jgi:8-oxo-dGTP diphosphatase
MPIEIAIALIRKQDGAYLITRRFYDAFQGGLWEFPGGKIEPGETPEETVKREVTEELGVEIILGEALPVIEYDYGDRVVRLHPFRASLVPRSKPVPVGCEEYSWVPPEKLHYYDFPAANSKLIRDLTPPAARKKPVVEE